MKNDQRAEREILVLFSEEKLVKSLYGFSQEDRDELNRIADVMEEGNFVYSEKVKEAARFIRSFGESAEIDDIGYQLYQKSYTAVEIVLAWMYHSIKLTHEN